MPVKLQDIVAMMLKQLKSETKKKEEYQNPVLDTIFVAGNSW